MGATLRAEGLYVRSVRDQGGHELVPSTMSGARKNDLGKLCSLSEGTVI